MSEANKTTYRTEKDFLGEKQIPAEVYYGVQTQRGKDNFHITGTSMSAETGPVAAPLFAMRLTPIVNVAPFTTRLGTSTVGAHTAFGAS